MLIASYLVSLSCLVRLPWATKGYFWKGNSRMLHSPLASCLLEAAVVPRVSLTLHEQQALLHWVQPPSPFALNPSLLHLLLWLYRTAWSPPVNPSPPPAPGLCGPMPPSPIRKAFPVFSFLTFGSSKLNPIVILPKKVDQVSETPPQTHSKGICNSDWLL